MSTTPPPIPIRGNPLTVTEKMLRSCLFQGGITGSISSDLTAVCNALKALEGQTPQMRAQAMALAAAFNTWLRGNHPGELSVLQTTPEFTAIQNFVAGYRVPDAQPPIPPKPASPSRLKSIGVCLFSVTNANHNFMLSLFERQQRLWTALKTFNDWLGKVNQAELQLDNPFMGIFIAPEYYFTKPSQLGVREFLDLTSKLTLDANLKGLSREFPKILLVPGTIHYEVEMTANDKVQTGYQLLQAAKNRILRENKLANPKEVLDVGMDHYDHDPANYPLTWRDVPSMNRLADNLLAKNTKPRKIHNTTCLLLNGTVWGTYDKHTDFYEAQSISPDQSMFVPGTQDECPVIGDGVRKFRFGVEICFDHGNGVLKRRAPANLQFHIVVSDSVQNSEANMAMKSGGYFLHASTDHGKTVIRRRGEGGQLEAPMAATLPMTWGPDFLDLFLIKLPLSLSPQLPPRRV
ncbi:MAG: hypothetical protein ABR912_05490 [Terracidiphilus sp.]